MLSADPLPQSPARLTAQTMPRALGSNRAIRITSWSPSILLQPLAANDVGGRYGEAVPYVVLPRMIAKTMRAILLASATATSLKGLVCMSFFAKDRIRKAPFSPPERAYGPQRPLTETNPASVWAGIFRFAAPREAPILGKH